MTSWIRRASLVPLGCLLLAAGCSDGAPEAGAPATTASEPRLLLPFDVEVDAQGRIYVADGELHQVLRFDPASGDVEVVAGNGTAGSEGDGGPAVDARIGEPTGLALAPDGTLFLADFAENRVRRVDPQGTVSTLAELIGPAEVALDPTGRFLAVPLLGHVVFRIDLRTGRSVRIAGNGNAATTGDGGPARGAQIESPHGAAYDPDGNLFLPDRNSIRRIDPHTGVITATASGVHAVKLLVAPGGGIYLTESEPTGGTIRFIDPDGTIHTVAGTGFIGADGEGGPALEAEILPSDVALAPDGALIVSQTEPEPAVRLIDLETGIITTLLR
jgi:DNA-binding beta-propeller fold protein YncE